MLHNTGPIQPTFTEAELRAVDDRFMAALQNIRANRFAPLVRRYHEDRVAVRATRALPIGSPMSISAMSEAGPSKTTTLLRGRRRPNIARFLSRKIWRFGAD